ncbi:carbohydrate-binding module family 13 protein [Hyaloscypha bicolor E]|uniref:Carbohydrate-binding module family 13 protein n=1 Tax=Hyaloscypha bicolor E TaxID=1095630 RepID=A0A2J6TBU3_9HELO|nr:carbohydrate-binding module family 13 protein [Hyaloscypha bicolor E]PMD60463.1 carbohydrate-binding module family 13 protein [Hyaloscypha bicolor E]
MSKPYNYDQPGLEVGLPPAQPDHVGYQQSPYTQAASKEGPPYAGQSTPPPRICGLPTRTFWIVFALALLVVGAALGGGLGGGLAASHKAAHVPSASSSNTGTPQQQQSTSLSSSTATSTSTSSTSAPSTISPFSTSPGTYRIINILTDTAIDLLYGGTAKGTEIEAWEWDPHSTPSSYVHQAWLISAVSNNVVTIFNIASSSYLTAPSGLSSGQDPSNSTLAIIYGSGSTGSPGDSYSQFTIVKNSDNSISFQSVAYQTKVLDVAGGGTTNGNPIVVWEPNGGLNQRWRLLAS